ncbi:MAG TPA: metalloregulator ArsR/SmtB family transcription factor [Gammaproteobacteria bacterium]|nr:metalloregulator ArsR/SmtB family transcription factor [Gammaproteobacteria bacterium]
MDQVLLFKALANKSRLQILQWMKDPGKHFGEMHLGTPRGKLVCVSEIQEKLGLSQSTASHYLAMLMKAGLVLPRRDGQYTFYERNEDALKELSKYLKEEI